MTLNIGIIGAGAIAHYAFLPGFAEPDSPQARVAMPDWYHNGCAGTRVVALASRTRAKAESLAREFNVPRIYDDWRNLLGNAEIDAVCVTTPNDLHHEMTIAACRTGKHVFVEKPLALNMSQAREMVDAARENKVLLMVHQNQRFFPVHEIAKQILDAKILGPILSLRARWSHAGPEHWSPEGVWFFDPARAGHGALFDLGIHKFDIIRYLTGKEAASVSALTGTLDKKIGVEDNGVSILKFTDQTLGVVEASWTSPPNENSVRLYGTRGFMQVMSDATYPLTLHFAEHEYAQSVQLTEGAWVNDTVFAPNIPATSATGGMFRHFADCITTGRECIASGADNLKSFEICLAAFESAASGQSVSLPMS